jgi:pyruvate/2-oxoglutarate dehydrogenase complex dihydrolipoamide acyltransferase (E2) component
MSTAYSRLPRNHFLSTHVRIVREWRSQDVVSFSQLVDLTCIGQMRRRYRDRGEPAPSYTAFVVDAVAQALRATPKMNRRVFRSGLGYGWVQFRDVDVALGTEATVDGVDIAYANVIRRADQLGLDGIAAELARIASAPADTPQLRRLQRLPPLITACLARLTGLHPRMWVQFRGGAASVTSPAKYGVESIIVKTSYPLQFAFGRVAARPMVIGTDCVARESFVLSMSWHRELTTGAVAAQFFEDIVQRLQRGAST